MNGLIEDVELTPRGFELVKFSDANQEECTLQQSSAMDDTDRGTNNPGSSYIWLGQGDDRMHLHRDHVLDLIELLRRWHKTGRFSSEESP